MSDLSRLRDLLDPVTARFGMEGASAASAIWTRWTDIVGASVAHHAEPTSLRRGVLRVRTDSPAWATEIGYLADDICARANEVAGRVLVREVRVWTSPAPISTRGEPRPPVTANDADQPPSKQPPTDPLGALERARRAWRNRVGKGDSHGFERDPGNR